MPSPPRRRNRDRFVMGTLGRSVLAARPAVFRCSAGAFLRSWLSPLSHSKLNYVRPLLLVSRRGSSPSPSLSAELGVDPESQETQIQSSEMNMVRVLFQLRKACVFGQHFFLVGDDPVLGGWDTERAISLVWSDGHLWSAEMSLPVGKTILFKFILKGSRGEVAWQPGPDRTIQTWDAKNTIVISEDWDNAELQKINEVLFEQTGNKTTVPSLLTEDEVDVAETEEVITLGEDEGSIIMDEHQPVLVPGLISAPSSIVEETIVDVEDIKFVPPVTVPSLLTEDEVDVAETEEVITLEEDEGSIITNEHEPVLVPGLISASTSIVEETIVDVEDIKFVPPVTSDEAIEGITFKKEEELLDESEKSIDPLHIVKPDEGSGESAVNMASEASEEDQATEEAPVTDDIFKNDIQWGYKSLLRFILNLGFQNNR